MKTQTQATTTNSVHYMSVRRADVCLKSNHNSKAKGSITSIKIIKAQKYLIIINFISNIIK